MVVRSPTGCEMTFGDIEVSPCLVGREDELVDDEAELSRDTEEARGFRAGCHESVRGSGCNVVHIACTIQ